MKDVYDFAKYFIKNDANSMLNTYDGNMKLQKLLVLANLAYISEYGEPLYEEQVLAFENGCVIEKVRMRYKNDYFAFKKESENFQPDFSRQEYAILHLVLEIFGSASAKELSEIHHTFDFWKIAFENGTDKTGFHDKSLSVVDMMSQKKDIEKMHEILSAYKEVSKIVMECKTVNEICFYYYGFKMTDEIMSQLETFSLSAKDNAYSVYMDNGKLVIY